MKRKCLEAFRYLRQKKSALKIVGIISIIIIYLLFITYISIPIYFTHTGQHGERYINAVIVTIPLNYTEVINIDVVNVTHVLKNYNYSVENMTDEKQNYYNDAYNCELQVYIVLHPTYDEFFSIQIVAARNDTAEWAYLMAWEGGTFSESALERTKKWMQEQIIFVAEVSNITIDWNAAAWDTLFQNTFDGFYLLPDGHGERLIPIRPVNCT